MKAIHARLVWGRIPLVRLKSLAKEAIPTNPSLSRTMYRHPFF